MMETVIALGLLGGLGLVLVLMQRSKGSRTTPVAPVVFPPVQPPPPPPPVDDEVDVQVTVEVNVEGRR